MNKGDYFIANGYEWEIIEKYIDHIVVMPTKLLEVKMEDLNEDKVKLACHILANKLNTCPEGRDCISGLTKERDCEKCWDIYLTSETMRGRKDD